MAIRDSLLPEFDHEMAQTRKCLERLPDDKFSWKPHEKSMSLGGLAAHLATLPHWTVDTLTKDFYDFAPIGGEPYKMPTLPTKKDVLACFDASVAAARAAIKGADDACFMGQWSLKKAGVTLMTMPRVACVRSWMLNHSYHHRGQLTVYFRLLGVPVPAIYGPSADEGQM